MNNIVGYYRFMMQRSLPIRLTIYGIIVSFPLSITFTIICLALNCSYSIFYKPCNLAIQDNPYECLAGGLEYCCGEEGSISCGQYLNCELKPDENVSTCEGLLITSWIIYFVFIVSVVLFFVIHRKLGPQIADDYTRMNQDIEISHNNNATEPQEPQEQQDLRESYEQAPSATIQNHLL